MTIGGETMLIREFHPGDGPGLRALWRGAGFRLIGDDDRGLAAFAERNPGLFFVAEADSMVAGSAMGAWDGRRGWLYHVAVDPAHRRVGLPPPSSWSGWRPGCGRAAASGPS